VKALCLACWLLVLAVLFAWPTLLSAHEPHSVSPPPSTTLSAPSETRPGRKVGAPQVLELPPQELTTPEGAAQPWAFPPATERGLGVGDPQNEGLRPEVPLPLVTKRNYLGVLYATTEEGQPGITVLDVVPSSLAARAGFQGASTPRKDSSDLVQVAILVLALSPVGPLAIPLALAHDMYTGHQSPGDVIVAVGDHPVHDAQEFSDEMRRHQPGETVSFSVMRAGKPLQIAVRLEEEPS
jgi:hypothetical protein